MKNPRRQGEPKKTETIIFRTTAEQKQSVGLIACEKGISPSKWIYEVLKEKLKSERQSNADETIEESSKVGIVFLVIAIVGLYYCLKRINQL